jgi:hypothetical protein
MDATTYRATEGISASDIKWILPPRTPAHYHAYKTGLIVREETRALVLGTLCHLAVLEPERLATAFAVRPAGLDFRTKDGKAWRDAQGEKPILDETEAAMLDGMSKSVAAHPAAAALLDGAQREVSLFKEHRTGLRLKGRLDVLGNGYVADVKTAEAGDAGGFAAAVFRYNYHVQAAMYCQLAGVERFSFITVEKVAPFAVAVYDLSAKALQVGLNSLNYALDTITACEEAGEWPAYARDAQTLDLPAWAYKLAEGSGQ